MTRHDYLIDQLFKEEADRKLARDFAAKYDGEPMMGDRIEPLLREAARTAQRADGGELTPEQAREYLGSFAREALGTPEHIVTSAMGWLGETDGTAVEEETRASMSPEMQQLIAKHDRDKALKDVTRFEEMMRKEPAEYWRPENQTAYREALERSIAVPEAVAAAPAPAPTAPAQTTLAPVPAAPASAPPEIQAAV